jgi:hypothetical protein
VRHFLWLIQLDEVLSTRDQEKLGTREKLVKRPSDTAVQGTIGVAKDDPDRTPEFFHLRDHLVAGPDHG